MNFLHNKRAQSALEYAVVLAVIAGALIAMQIYMKRGIEGRFRSSTDDIGEQFDAKKADYSYTTTRNATTKDETDDGITSTFMGEDSKGANEVVKKHGTEHVDAW